MCSLGQGEPHIIYRANLNLIVKVLDFVKSGGPSGIRTQSLGLATQPSDSTSAVPCLHCLASGPSHLWFGFESQRAYHTFQTYNRSRPHSSLGYWPPAPETILPKGSVLALGRTNIAIGTRDGGRSIRNRRRRHGTSIVPVTSVYT